MLWESMYTLMAPAQKACLNIRLAGLPACLEEALLATSGRDGKTEIGRLIKLDGAAREARNPKMEFPVSTVDMYMIYITQPVRTNLEAAQTAFILEREKIHYPEPDSCRALAERPESVFSAQESMRAEASMGLVIMFAGTVKAQTVSLPPALSPGATLATRGMATKVVAAIVG